MKRLIVIAILCLSLSSAWAGQVYTNADLNRYNAAKGQSTIKSPTALETDKASAHDSSGASGAVTIKDQDYRFTKSGSGYSYYSWQVKLRNTYDERKGIYLEFKFLDKKGFEIEMTNENVTIGAHKTETFRGASMMKSYLRQQIAKTYVTIKVR